jgi:endonuclease/exonuclease/phosphatase family metal-dependent hydrolase
MSKILFSNIGYARGIDGSIKQNFRRIWRYIYCGRAVQQDVLKQLRSIIDAEKPDICCLVEIDQGSLHSDYFNQIEALVDEHYAYHDVADKYGKGNRWKRLSFFQGRSNAFLSNRKLEFEKFYFSHGTKRLLYRLHLPEENIYVFFGHFALDRDTRKKQFTEANSLMRNCPGDIILLADFNIWHGFSELAPLMKDTSLKIISREDDYTFSFHNRHMVLDVCLCSEALRERLSVKVIDQPFSDHQALLVEFQNLPDASGASTSTKE